MRRKVRRGYRNGEISKGRLILLTLIFWAVSGFVMLTFISNGDENILNAKGDDMAKLYISSIFPTISRGAEYETRETISNNLNTSEENSQGLFQNMIGSMFPAAEVLDDDMAEEDPGIIFDTGDNSKGIDPSNGLPSVTGNQTQEEQKPATADIDYSKPVVIIYHTHATETYQPVIEGNFHSLNEYGTVREVGNVLAAELEAKGIQVIHDKTIHDSPSYNQSYNRSLETVKKLMGNNKSAVIIIDLHRDAAGYSGNVAKTVKIKKDTIAKYSLVIGKGNPNAQALTVFANHVNKKAEELYPGFGGKIIEKEYKFNQYVSDYHLLLEVGNNENTIEQAKLTGKYFANVLKEVIKDID